jgi:DUF1680 family protein
MSGFLNFVKALLIGLVLFGNIAFAADRGITNTSTSPNAELRAVDIDDVKWTKGFWAEKFRDFHKVAIPNMWKVLTDPEIGHAYQNFEIAAGLKEGEFKGTYWHDGDFYKLIEATAYVYAVTKDAKLDELMDDAIDVIAKAQRDDGYLHTAIQIGHGIYYYNHPTFAEKFEGLSEPFQIRTHHELYNFGHLLTAGCIHYRATGKKELLEVAIKAADFLYKTFEPRPVELAHFGWNPSNIMGLVELYRTTKEPKYLELAGIFVDMRGSASGGSDQNQFRTPLREETEAVGHAVTANYLYAGAADVVAETGEKKLFDVLDAIWTDIVHYKMSLTGGNGPLHKGVSTPERDIVWEAYSRPYHLPNATAYNETCGNISNAMFNWRMLTLTGEARFMDVMELILYNSSLSGISLDCKSFYYTNPLSSIKGSPRMSLYPDLSMDYPVRQSYLPCFCCPPSVVRAVVKSHGWAYSVSDAGIWVNMYGGNELDTELLDGTGIKLTQETDYPWDGKVKITVQSPKKKEYALMLRIPEWVSDAELRINDKSSDMKLEPGTYASIKQTWAAGDVVELTLPMPAELMVAHPHVEETRNQVAVKRGPVVYCLESSDLPSDVRVLDVVIPIDMELKPVFEPGFLGGVSVVKGEALLRKTEEWGNTLYRQWQSTALKPVDLTLIPYFSWSNRGESEMTVWMPVSRLQ